MFEEKTPENIREQILAGMSNELDKREGSYTSDLVSPVAYEIWKLYDTMNELIPIAFVDETSGTYIDRRCAEYGITRKEPQKASGYVKMTCAASVNNQQVPVNTCFTTNEENADNRRRYYSTEAVTVKNGTALVNVEAEQTGTPYNVEPGAITQLQTALAGITVQSITNEKAVEGGTDDSESDKDLVERLYKRLRDPGTSGNASHYQQWATEVPGIGDAKIVEEHMHLYRDTGNTGADQFAEVNPIYVQTTDGSGNTVYVERDIPLPQISVYVIGPDKKPVTDDVILKNCWDHIETCRPIGVNVNVLSAATKRIDISVKAELLGLATIEQVRDDFRTALEEYIKKIAFKEKSLRYNHVVNLLLNVNGVKDIGNLQISGVSSAPSTYAAGDAEKKNILFAENEVPVLGNVDVEPYVDPEGESL
ncbi:baseplate J/gp47 family protein [Clostridium sp. D33t1_170424_F3]|uniref:baseplate J/gp47 family protein n=1 Tax=Clostridium sp. D33t1_170424_F3 TaxID=2787099 RepID=UPI0018A98A10|nr:baseplate J/gp47 family protein [Clostridium sp. D33t1_170424_F3]